MYNEKEYRIVREFKYKGYKYYALLAKDGDRFFLKDKNGAYDYLVYEEYVEIDNLFKINGILRNENTYVITYSNKKTNKESFLKKIKTCKLVWRKKILLPLAIAAMLAVGVPTAVSAQKYHFDNNLRMEQFADYGIYLDEILEFDDIFDLYSNDETEEETQEHNPVIRNVKVYSINGVDTSRFPFLSNYLSKKNFEHAYVNVDREQFCKKENISDITYEEIYKTINNLDIDDANKKLFINTMKKVEENYPKMDLRILYYNLKNIEFIITFDESVQDSKADTSIVNPYIFDLMNKSQISNLKELCK